MSSRLSKICVRLLLAGAVVVVLLYSGSARLRSFNRKLEALGEEITEIERENKLLQSEIDALREDPFFIERQAREMGLTKEGEKVFNVRFIEELEDEN